MFRSLLTTASLIAILSWMAVPAAGADKEKKKKPDPEKQFAKMDANNDQKVTLDEFKGKRDAAKAEKAFNRLDKNSDGSLTLAEFKDRPKKKK